MAYQEIPVDQFGGLDLANDPEEVGLAGAVDMLNVDVSSAGRLRTRPGLQQIAYTGNVDDIALKVHFGVGPSLLVSQTTSGGGYVKAFTTAGAYLAGEPVTATGFANVGTPSSSATYFATGTALHKWDGTTFSTVSGIGAALVAQSPVDNRLVVATSAASASRIRFSDPGAPETFAANNYIDLDPGDGEYVSGLVTWRDMVFAFKQTKIFMFTGVSIGPTSEPIFNVRPIRTEIGARDIAGGGVVSVQSPVVAGPDGVYFLAIDGVYRTTGDTPVKISDAIDPWFKGQSLPLNTSLPAYATVSGNMGLSADARYLFLRADTVTLTFDTQTQRWTLYSIPIAGADTDPQNARTIVGSGFQIAMFSQAMTTDNGVPFSWRYRTGASDLGSTVPKLVKQTQVWGTGDVTASVYADHGTTDPGAANLSLGTAPAVIRSQQFYSRQGTFFSIGLSGTGPAIIHRAVLGVAEQRLTGVG